jgi:hypothetical protein
MGNRFPQIRPGTVAEHRGDAFMRHVVLSQLNTTVSNVRGPDATLYLAGARLVHLYPVRHRHRPRRHQPHGLQLQRRALDLGGRVPRHGARSGVPTADCIRKSFDELLTAADKRGKAAAKTAAKPAAKAARRGRTTSRPAATSTR